MNNYIIVVQATCIATDFYNAFIKAEDTIKLYISDGSFKEVKLELNLILLYCISRSFT